jgi:hypothetical protein
MGNCLSGGSTIDPAARDKNRKIDEMLKEERIKQRTEVKLLLLGIFSTYYLILIK